MLAFNFCVLLTLHDGIDTCVGTVSNQHFSFAKYNNPRRVACVCGTTINHGVKRGVVIVISKPCMQQALYADGLWRKGTT